MNEKTDKYTAELARHLRFRGVDEKQVQEAVWSVESHTADSGTSPQQAFGSPRDYARTFTPATTAGPGDTPLYLVGWLIGTLAGALLIISVSAQDQEVVLGLLPPAAGIVLASVILVAWGVLVLVRLTRRPKPNSTDPSGSDVR